MTPARSSQKAYFDVSFARGPLAYAVASGGVNTDMRSGFPKDFHHLPLETPRLVADTLKFLTQEQLEWLADRYVDFE